MVKGGSHALITMFFFFHLFTGLVIGVLAGDLLHDRRWIFPCAVGAVLPDLIDKPVGQLIFADSIGYGRIYAHTLFLVLLLLILGISLWRYNRSPVLLALSAGAFSHGVLDLIWLVPTTWFYPYLGPFSGKLPPDYIVTLLISELMTPSEIVLGIVLCAGLIILYLVKSRFIAPPVPMNSSAYKKIILGGSVVLYGISGILIGLSIISERTNYFWFMGWSRPEELFIGGVITACSAYLLWRWQAVWPETTLA